MKSPKSPPLVSPQWLAPRLRECKVLDASWYLPNQNRDTRAEFQTLRIPHAHFFDHDKDTDNKPKNYPHMMPSKAFFQEKMRKMGIGKNDHVVAYDTQGLFSAPRLWWMLRAFGHEKVSVLEGGLKAWIDDGQAVEKNPPAHDDTTPPSESEQGEAFVAVPNPKLLLQLEDVRANLALDECKSVLMIDARSAGRFAGVDPEPRKGLLSGHIPRSVNVPFTSLVNGESGTLFSESQLRSVFVDAGVSIEGVRALGVTCGSGMTAAIIAIALARLGRWDVGLYDGSFAQWGDPTLGNPVDSDA